MYRVQNLKTNRNKNVHFRGVISFPLQAFQCLYSFLKSSLLVSRNYLSSRFLHAAILMFLQGDPECMTVVVVEAPSYTSIYSWSCLDSRHYDSQHVGGGGSKENEDAH